MREPDLAIHIESSFKPKIIENMKVVFLKEDERGKFYIISNPENSRYIKVHESICNLLKMFDGTNSIADVEKRILEEEIPIKTQELLELLAEDGFVENLKHKQKAQVDDYYSFKLKFFTLDAKVMNRLYPLFSWVQSLPFKIFYMLFCFGGLSLFLYNINPILSEVVELWKPETSILPLLLGLPLFYLVKFSHELSHAMAYHSFEGRSVNMGLEFHFLMPFFYTDTPDTRKMTIRETTLIFLAGSFTSIFFAEIFAYMFVLNKELAPLWALGAFTFHLGTLFSLMPILRTDGYFIVQSVLKFPNLMQNGISNIAQVLKLLSRKISLKDYRSYLSQYSVSERKILIMYTLCFCVTVFILIYISVVLAFLFSIVDVLSLTPAVFAGQALYPKVYLLWTLYVVDIVISLIGMVGTAVHAMRKASKGAS